MKKTVMAAIGLMTILILFPFGVSGAPAYDSGKSFRDVEEKEWILEELRTDGKTVYMDRKKLEAEGLGGVYTIIFRGSDDTRGAQVSGLGAPNRYFGPYTSDSNRSLSFGNLATTMMASFREPDGLKESDYLGYLTKVTRWDLREGKLELYSSDNNGGAAILVFVYKL